MNSIQTSRQQLYEALLAKTGWGRNEFKSLMQYILGNYKGNVILQAIQKEITKRLMDKTGWGRVELKTMITEVYIDILAERLDYK